MSKIKCNVIHIKGRNAIFVPYNAQSYEQKDFKGPKMLKYYKTYTPLKSAKNYFQKDSKELPYPTKEISK